MRESTTRRDVLRSAAASGALAGLTGCLGGGGAQTETPAENTAFASYPVGEETVTFGATVPQSGPFGPDGKDQRRGFELAVAHVNEGGGWVDADLFGALDGDGLRGRTVEAAVGDTKSSPSTAATVGQELIDREGAIMVAGGGSTNTAKKLLDVCQPRGVVHMLGFAPGTNVTGTDCRRYGFQEMYNATMAANALAPVLTARFEGRTDFYQLHASSDYGYTQADQFRQRMQDENWNETGTTETRVGTENYESQLSAAADTDPDVVVLNYRGIDGANAVQQAEQILGTDVTVVVPILSRSLASFAGSAIEGVLGTIAWDQSIDTPLSNSLAESYRAEYGSLPSDQAQLAYGQTLQYAAAVERAGTFRPPDVVKQLEGATYAMGMGSETMRACDHQAIRPVPIVEGLPASEQTETRRYEFVDVTRDAAYGCEEYPASNCYDLGPYVPGEE
ncbi:MULTISPECIES: ABC transporter substrate-binding protein [Haloarcula]|uniref:Leucine-binding protein domain-containing protein n=1 Tax=Haloarcula pellucida TaxID=1427151 RepID=A0A830GU99_9EURY|nr:MULTISPECIES: ABC transporter substrate-binding protein [Halomicroarcula]MBX0349524.1 ABC transporter substrate-binding protein [Halomicroarcula pellucida]MDS0278889.1 ABC transporter substrate-binding protein [Halomicroarcula sp. S1AR25-4]GGO02511.1 hypothetical protein GCM10009030_37180 [Halomicroarcula pellucida]